MRVKHPSLSAVYEVPPSKVGEWRKSGWVPERPAKKAKPRPVKSEK